MNPKDGGGEETEASNIILNEIVVNLALICRHISNVTDHYQECIAFLEQLLLNQVVKAIGRQITAEDFSAFMRYHNRRLFGPKYRPTPFCYAIRQPDHAPDGVIRIESEESIPIDSMVRCVKQNVAPLLNVPISAATTISLKGDWYLHGWMLHQFANKNPSNFSLAARARQFSSFLLVIGTMSGPNQLEPKHAIILQNKDDLLIPLLTEVLPSAKDFKRATASLSPEQLEFCQAFRSMQLES